MGSQEDDGGGAGGGGQGDGAKDSCASGGRAEAQEAGAAWGHQVYPPTRKTQQDERRKRKDEYAAAANKGGRGFTTDHGPSRRDKGSGHKEKKQNKEGRAPSSGEGVLRILGSASAPILIEDAGQGGDECLKCGRTGRFRV